MPSKASLRKLALLVLAPAAAAFLDALLRGGGVLSGPALAHAGLVAGVAALAVLEGMLKQDASQEAPKS